MISLLIIAHEEHDKLSLHLPALFDQQGTEFEVVVVDMNSEDETIDLLKSLQETHPQLHYLSMPTSARDISREQLALHLGMRATSFQKVLVLSASIQFTDKNWLASIEKRWRTDCNIMLIPTKRTRSKNFGDYFTAGHEAWHNALHQKQALQNGLYRAGNMTVGLNKEVFLRHSSPASHLALKTGTLDIFISQTANPYNTIILTEKNLLPTTDANKSSHFWSQKRLFYVETNRHLTNRSKRSFIYLLHCLCTIHRGSLFYSILDFYDKLRWMFTKKETFIKQHY